jgi:hypothetical protein
MMMRSPVARTCLNLEHIGRDLAAWIVDDPHVGGSCVRPERRDDEDLHERAGHDAAVAAAVKSPSQSGYAGGESQGPVTKRRYWSLAVAHGCQ